MFILIPLAWGVLLLLFALIMRPIRTLVLIVRFVSFLLAAMSWWVAAVSHQGSYFWPIAVLFTVLWMLTFIRRRQRIHIVHEHNYNPTALYDHQQQEWRQP